MAVESPIQLATNYLIRQWKSRFNQVPPLDLVASVSRTVMATGYTKAVVDGLIDSYLAAQKEGK